MSALPNLPAGIRKAVVAYVDVHFGSFMAATLNRQGVEVIGILHDAANATQVVPGLKRVVLRNNAEAVRKALLDSDYIVFQMVDNAQDAMSAIKLLYTTHFDSDKRFVLVSSLLTWAETPPLADPPAPSADDEAPELEALTEDQYNRRVPHVKYLAWREAEKLVAASNNDRLKTFVIFSGLPYGRGEELLHPLFKQAWSLAPEGLPIYGNGKQVVPMIHVADLVRFVAKLFVLEEIPELRYFFAVDDGNCTWNDVIKALNTALGNGKTFKVPSQELCLYDNVEQFLVNLKLDAQQMQSVMTEEDWISKTGFVENIETVVTQYREDRGVTPLRLVLVGPPQAGKSFAARELAEAYRMPCFDVSDIIAEYKYQDIELREELLRIREERVSRKVDEKLEERRQAIVEERKAAKEAALAEKGETEDTGANDDLDDIEEEDEIDVRLTAEEEKEIRDAVAEDNDDERITLINEKLDEVKKVLSLRVKPQVDASLEPLNPKDKKKAPPPKKDPKKPAVEEPEEPQKDARFTDRALAIMTRWKLTRMQCRNHGFVLDGFPKTIRQARLVFEDTPIDLPEDNEETEPPLDEEVKPCNDKIFPTFVLHVKAPDSFLLDRLQRTQAEHPHNNPEDFMRRLDFYKQHYDVAYSALSWFESSRTAGGKSCTVKSVDMDQCPLVVPAVTRSANAPKLIDPTITKIMDLVGKPHNFGPTPQDAHRELVRQRTLAEEQAQEQEAQLRRRKDKELVDVAAAQKLLQEQRAAANKVKESERKMLEARKAPLKAYLMQQVIPVLTKGLIEVCNRKPEDPIDFLAEWLFRHNPEDDDTVYQ